MANAGELTARFLQAIHATRPKPPVEEPEPPTDEEIRAAALAKWASAGEVKATVIPWLSEEMDNAVRMAQVGRNIPTEAAFCLGRESAFREVMLALLRWAA